MRFIKQLRLALTVLVLSFGLTAVILPSLAAADTPQSTACQALGSDSSCSSTPSSQGVDVNHLITLIVNILSIAVGVASVIMIIVGGLRYITSGGDSNNITGAKNTVLYAIIGLIIAALAQFLVQFVLDKTK